MDARALYQATIMDHARAPRHAAMPEAADVEARRTNPLCGDRVDVALRLDGPVIAEVGVVTRGCALCVAAGSLMAERVRSGPPLAARQLAERFAADLEPGAADDPGDLGDLTAFRGVREFASRKRCALLPWEALLDALEEAGA